MNIHDWMSRATKIERQRLADSAETSVAYLWQLSGGHRRPSSSLAEKLENGSREVTPDMIIDKVSAIFGESKVA